MSKIPTETQEQEAFVKWLDLKKIRYFAPPSSFFSHGKKDNRFWGMIASMKKLGWSKGFPDLAIFLPGEVIFIEMKIRSGGKVSPEQEEWHKALGILDHTVYVARGFDDAVQCIEQHLESSTWQ